MQLIATYNIVALLAVASNAEGSCFVTGSISCPDFSDLFIP